MKLTAYVLGREKYLAAVKAMPGGVRLALLREMSRIVVYLQRLVKSNKLSGDPLHVRTGVLRNSIYAIVDPTTITGIVGTNVHYGRVHEYGFTGDVWVPDHLRRHAYVMRGEETIRVKLKSKAKGKITGASMVHGHLMRMNLPERSFLRSTLWEEAPTIREALQIAAAEGLKQ
jgi:phage gpG-like protein